MASYGYENGAFIIEGYDKAPAFCSFLPGLAGMKGIPIWTYYVNRGQGICSFGIENKNGSIMEFSPANTAYRRVSREGFRTFIKKDTGEAYEPFAVGGKGTRVMRIEPNCLTVEEQTDNLLLTVCYFVMPGEDFPALVRSCRLTNISEEPQTLRLLDGLTEIIPYGMTTQSYKEMSNLNKSWAHVTGQEFGIPFYHTRTIPSDETEVEKVSGGYFYLSFGEDGERIRPFVDPALIFGEDTSYSFPISFAEPPETQVFTNQYCCGFTPLNISLSQGKSYEWATLIGYTPDPEHFSRVSARLCSLRYISEKLSEARTVADKLTDAVATKTAMPLFDGYVRQSYMDNALRGGEPVVIGGKVIHLYSRKHGDPERDYNFFSIAAEYFSQGNGNFRDVCQNRRNDVFFTPEAGEYNILTFFSLMQADGYNPLEVRGTTLSILPGNEAKVDELLESCGNHPALHTLMKKPFTAGQIINTIAREGIHTSMDEMELLAGILSCCRQNIEAVFGEGFWIDHWTYLMDLIDGYIKIFPDRLQNLLFDNKSYRFFESPVYVKPRNKRFELKNGKLRALRALEVIEGRPAGGWLKTSNGEIYETTLMVKLISLAAVKFASLDPYGCGISMDGGRPGWNDAMNGLPALLGSGIGESYELLRLLRFIQSIDGYEKVTLPEEVARLLRGLRACGTETDSFSYWDMSTTMLEKYRESLISGLSGAETSIGVDDIRSIVTAFISRLELGLRKAEDLGNGIVPTFLTFEARLNGNRIKGFDCIPLPAFLEGPVRQLKTITDTGKAGEIAAALRSSELFDKELNMMRTSVSLEECGYDIGRIRAFTPGWLERESIFMHMSFKYLLELIKSGLYDEFFIALRESLPPFFAPEVYGRSTMENCSFIASSNNPNPGITGRGFVSRLTGSTSEVLSMWTMMFIGKKGFGIDDNGELTLTLDPVLPDWLFPDNGEISFTLMGKVPAIYKNTSRKPTYGGNAVRPAGIKVALDGETVRFNGGVITGRVALAIREGKADAVHVTLE